SITIKEFFKGVSGPKKYHLSLQSTNPVLFKCFLVAAQKSPTISGTSELLNVEQLLNQVKSSDKEAVVTLRRLDELNLFYFRKGKLQEAFFTSSASVTPEIPGEDQFLEYIYGGDTSIPVHVQAFYDVKVTPAADSDLSWQNSSGNLEAYFLKDRPELVFVSGGESVEKKTISTSLFALGRNPNSDLVIPDSLASRDHAVIRETAGQFIIEDNKSRNGTFVNSKKITKVPLSDGDEIQVGDFKVMFIEKSGSSEPASPVVPEELEATRMKTHPVFDMLAMDSLSAGSKESLALEMVKGNGTGTTFSLKTKTIIGRSKADINTGDAKTSRHHAAIEKKEDGYFFTDLKSTNGSFINEKEATIKRLAPGDIIRIGDVILKVIVDKS
ncbi:MAG TPA: FHA domain-containing protein, partial [Nitrospiria bacterium]|nr:FHA domain-containing protein [Nitrospiria bacterium]